jgi:hypothetical protein
MRASILAFFAATFASGALCADNVAKVEVYIVMPGGFNALLFVDVPLGQYYEDEKFNQVSTLTLRSPEGVTCSPYVEDNNGGHDGDSFTVGKPSVLSTTGSVKVRHVWCV